ncbi:MAG: ATP-binding cassette domain-containing protein [Devosiaceae bacterium]|nr:ATP-binding cassette domain-containing protein [Devosiaceae bacterium]
MAQPAILTLSDIMLTFGGNPLFEGLNLSVNQGERICLVGRNGSGKSTLLKVMAGIMEPDAGDVFLRPGNAVAYMEQDPDLSAYETLGDYASSGLDPSEYYRVEMVMEGVKLNVDQSPAQASGGERRRAALAKLLASDADLMLLDEPTNHLDIEVVAWLEEHLKQTRRAYVIISHDRAFLRNLTRTTLWVDRGVVRRSDKGFEHFEDWRDRTFEEEDLNRHKLDRLIKAEARWAVEGISGRRKRNIGRVGRLDDMKQGRAEQIRRTGTARMEFDGGPKSGKLVFEATDVSKAYDGKQIVKDFNLRVMRGERIAFVGPNGVGKTTLINLLTSTLAPDEGEVRIGSSVQMALLDQTRATLPPDTSLKDALTGGGKDTVLINGSEKHVIGYMKDFLFSPDQLNTPLKALSGGERARVMLARALALPSNLLVLDEPTNDLDLETLDLLQETLAEYPGTLIIVSHDRDFIDRVATITLIAEGDGTWTTYAGGYADMVALRGFGVRKGKTLPKAVSKAQSAKKPSRTSVLTKKKLSFNQQHALKTLPEKMANLESDMAGLRTRLEDPGFYSRDPQSFADVSKQLQEKQTLFDEFENQWLELEILREELL